MDLCRFIKSECSYVSLMLCVPFSRGGEGGRESFSLVNTMNKTNASRLLHATAIFAREAFASRIGGEGGGDRKREGQGIACYSSCSTHRSGALLLVLIYRSQFGARRPRNAPYPASRVLYL